jgi:hypothetical protein
MNPRTLLTGCLLAALPAGVLAHEGHDHGKKLMGTVTAVHADRNHVEMKTTKGEVVAFMVDAKTKFLKGTASVALSALTPGTRVVVETKTVDKAMVATVIRIGGAGPSQKAATVGARPPR